MSIKINNEDNSYLVSIVTPFHNIDSNMFKKTVESMKKQTIGFDNIQWIIVMHNCEKKDYEAVLQLVGNCSNVLLKVLNNEKHTASSPRNYGLKYVVAPYVGFLDGDDTYTIDCLKAARQELEETGAQIVAFRMEYELDKE